MEEHNILCIANRSEFRAWLEAHHASERECCGDMGIKQAQDDYQRLINNKSPKNKRR